VKKSELVRLIGDVLTEMDVLAGSLAPGSAERKTVHPVLAYFSLEKGVDI